MKKWFSNSFGLAVMMMALFTRLVMPASMGQAIESSVTSSSGGVTVAGGVCLSYTLGEALVEGGAAGATVLTTGFQQPSSYDYWSAGKGLPQGPLEDSDGDGVFNLLEYAFGTDPLLSTSQARPSVSIGPGGKVSLTMLKGTAAGDLTWSVEASTDLKTWSTQGVTVTVNNATTFSALYSGNAPAFLRLRISLSGTK